MRRQALIAVLIAMPVRLPWRRHIAVGLLALLSAAHGMRVDHAAAQDWPVRPVRITVPYGPGGISDVLARLTADRMTRMFGQPFVIENRGGAGGIIGTEFAAHLPNDGYNLYLAGGAQLTVNPLVKKLSYDPLKDFTPVSMVSINGMALTVHPDLPARSVRELIAYVKANPGRVNYASAGLGQSSHLTPAAFAAREGLDMVVVPYKARPRHWSGCCRERCSCSSATYPMSSSWCEAARRACLRSRPASALRSFRMSPRSMKPCRAS